MKIQVSFTAVLRRIYYAKINEFECIREIKN